MALSVRRTDDEKFGTIAVCNWSHSAKAITAYGHFVITLAPFDSDINDNNNHEKVIAQIVE